MGSRYLTELPQWCREAGLTYVEYDGWQTRARSSGGFDGDRPWCIMWHHTASQSSPDDDANYMCHVSGDRPIANVLIDRSGVVWILAAGATNTNGKGQSIKVSKGTIPKDSMNTHGFGVEIANSGVGERYPVAQVDAAFKLNNKLCEKLGMQPTDLSTHQFYAPDRKIDPATAEAVEGPWGPREVTSSGTWNRDDVRSEASDRAGDVTPPGPDPGPEPTPPEPAPPIEEDDMRITAALDSHGTIWVGNGIHRIALDNMDVFNNYVVLGVAGCYQLVNTSGQIVREVGHVREVGDVTIEALGVVIG